MARKSKPRFSEFALLMHLAAGLSFVPTAAEAAGDMTRQEPVEIRVQLGNPQGEMLFAPNELNFETGKLYKVVLSNPSPVAHYFTSPALSGAVFTRKVQVNGPDGKAISEIKGSVSELEVYPGGTVEWWFVPIKTTSGELKCTIAGHAEHGMVGKVNVK